MWWRAINRSLLAGGVLLLLIFAFGSYELWFVPPGEGYLNSEGNGPYSEAEKIRDFTKSVILLPVKHAILAGLIFALHVPFLLLRELFGRLGPA
jgi:ABC-type microcin C transport system permease subunit YejB